MRLLTVDALVVCAHELGKVGLVASQSWVTVEGRPMLVRADPEGRPIAGCPNIGPTIKPCTSTLAVKVGYSDLVRIGGRYAGRLSPSSRIHSWSRYRCIRPDSVCQGFSRSTLIVNAA